MDGNSMVRGARVEMSAEPLAGRIFGKKYVIESVLGRGGMGTVFEARHARLGSRVALKILGASFCDVPELVTRFEREGRAAGALSSPHAVKVLDIDVDDAHTPYIVMELLEGQDLSRILDNEGPQPIDRSVRWIMEACHAIAEAHRLGIVHRDIKPSNLFLANVAGRAIVKVLDFGIAKLASTPKDAAITAAPLGTPQYMSPEQVRCAKTVDARTDVWSLGVSLYELVTGEPPFAFECPSACIASIAADPVPDPRKARADLPEAFVAVLMKALAKAPEERYQTVTELVEALGPFAGDADFVRLITPLPSLTPLAATLGEEGFLSLPSPPPPVEIAPMLVLEAPRPKATGVRRAPLARLRSKPVAALGGGFALMVAALVGTPTCVSSTSNAAPAAMMAPPPVSTVVEAPPAPVPAEQAPAAAASDEPPAAADAGEVDTAEPPPAAAPKVATKAPLVLRNRDAARDARQMLNEAPKREPALVTASRSRVHGGLSGPGF